MSVSLRLNRRGKRVWTVFIDHTDLDGKRWRVKRVAPGSTKRAAERFEREIMARIIAGTFQRKENKKKVPRLSEFEKEFIECYAKVHNRPSAVNTKKAAFRLYLLPAMGHRRLDEIAVRHVEHLKADLVGRGLKPKTVNNVTGILGKALRWAMEMEIIDKVPKIRKLPTTPPEFDFLDFAEADRLLEAARYNPEWRAMFFLALRTGLRFGEISELRWGDVDLVTGRLVVRRAVWKGHVGPPKNGRNREIPLSAETVAFLKNHRHLKSDLVFCKGDGTRHIHRRVDVALKRCCKKAGLRPIGIHVLRHSFASHLTMRGVSLKATQELMGHSSTEMTLRYAHLSPNVRKEAVEALDTQRESAKTWQM